MAGNYSRFLTAAALSRQPSPIRVLTGIQAQAGPELISLAAGAPNAATFPFEKITVQIAGKSIPIEGAKLKSALQYSPTPGTANFLKHLRNLQHEVHNFEPGNHNICVCTGSQDGLGKVMEALISPGDKVIVDTPIYSGTLAAMRPLKPDLIGIKTDENGLDMDDLERALENEAKTAKILITVVNGSNPTGGSLSPSRRERLLELAEKHDLFIIEDDPYYWLDFQEEKANSLFKLNQKMGYTESAPDGRVLRSDSLSKIVSSGIRIGWLTGPTEIIERVILHQQASVMHTPTLNQELVALLFDEWKGVPGFVKHTEAVTEFYKQQCDAIMLSCNKYLTGLATWERPKAGMFLWLTVPGVTDTKRLIEAQALENNVLLVPGQAFMPKDEVTNTCRLSFSQETPERMDEAVRRLAEMIKREINH